jgi:hypothetical protein
VRRWWLCALLALGTVALSASVRAPASAAELPSGWRQVSRLPAALRAPTRVERTVRLRSQATTATFGGLDYRMSYVAEHSPTAEGGPVSFLDVVLSRTAPVRQGRAMQTNQYSFQPATPFTFTWTHGSLANAHLDTAHAIAPDVLEARFAATSEVVESPCPGGAAAHVRHTTGSIAYSALSIDTDSLPFFGTLTSGPPKGRLEVVQGCDFAAGQARLSQCLGRQELTAFRTGQFWTFGSTFGGSTRTQGHLDFGSFIESPVRIRTMDAPMGLTAFPKAVHSRYGATAHVAAAGNPFMSGSATFHSNRRPQTSALLSCLSHGHVHRFRTVHYDGKLVPDAAPLTARYDTGSAALRPSDAELLLRVYVS